MWRFIGLCLSCFLIGVVPFCAAAEPLKADYVVVGAWNIEHLGRRTPGQRPIAIAEHIEHTSSRIGDKNRRIERIEESGTVTGFQGP